MSEPLSYIVFTDFDGTITLRDIGESLFRVFGDPEHVVTSQGAEAYWRSTCETVTSLTPEVFDSFLEDQEIDGSFRRFEELCSRNGIPIYILSDGFDVYIEQVLRRERLSHLPFFSNHLSIGRDGSVVPEFPYTDAECIMCANCKRNHLLTRSGENHVIVYIGNGQSDCCPARYADLVFAKETLLRFCERENITYHRFETFADVAKKFEELIASGKPRKRRTAELARKDLFMQG